MSEEKSNIDTQVESMNDNIGTILYIMLGRIYDQLVLLADANGKGEDMMRLMQMHTNGNVMSPLPALNVPEFESEESSSTTPENLDDQEK